MSIKKVSSVLASAALVIILGTPVSALAGGNVSFQAANFTTSQGGLSTNPAPVH